MGNDRFAAIASTGTSGQSLLDQFIGSHAERGASLPRIADLHQWSLEQSAHLRAGRYDLLDISNVADEIEAVGRSEFNELVGNLTIILLHMLKWEHQPVRRTRSWTLSIVEHRDRIADNLRDSPSLRGRFPEAVARAYRYARAKASSETDLNLRTFPVECPYDDEAILQKAFVLADE